MKTELPVSYQSFKEIDLLHRYTDQLFIGHQIHLMKKEWEDAFGKFEKVFEFRNQNISDEEELLIPLYESTLKTIPEGGAVQFFIREHKLIRKNLSKYLSLLGKKALNPESINLDLVRLFDEYYDLKDLFDHHDARERGFLFPALDENVSAEERGKLLKTITMRQNTLLKKWGDIE
ncbi:MAG: hypothetical protein AB7T22_15635 [Calditrichaceae bacterium]